MNPRFIPLVARCPLVLILILALLPCISMAKDTAALDVQLINAAESGDSSRVQNLLDEGADVNGRDSNHNTALMRAGKKGHAGVVKLLLERGAKVNATNLEGRTPLTEAAIGGRVEVASLLIETKADVNATDRYGSTALMWSAWTGHREVAKLLLDKGADVNAKAMNGETALRKAVAKPDIVKLLLDKGADVNADKEALWLAVFGGNLETLQLLLDKGADVNARTLGGRTLLMEVAASDHQIAPWYHTLPGVLVRIILLNPWGPVYRSGAKDPQIIKLLLQKGADVNAEDQDGWTALKRAQWRGATEIVQLLKVHGAKE